MGSSVDASGESGLRPRTTEKLTQRAGARIDESNPLSTSFRARGRTLFVCQKNRRLPVHQALALAKSKPGLRETEIKAIVTMARGVRWLDKLHALAAEIVQYLK